MFPDQFIDFGKEVITFYDTGKVYHVSLADPFCSEIRKTFIDVTKGMGIRFHDKGTYLRVVGPRFSTRAESHMFRHFADIIGMTCIPEAILAREKEICYGVIAAVTDYDVWDIKPVDAEEVMQTMRANQDKIERIINEVVSKLPEQRNCECKDALKNAGV